MARLTSVSTSSVVGNPRSNFCSSDPGGREEPYFEARYPGNVGRRTKAARIRVDGTRSVRAECCQIPVYSSPSVCVASPYCEMIVFQPIN